jgi:hypothetical protein
MYPNINLKLEITSDKTKFYLIYDRIMSKFNEKFILVTQILREQFNK